MDEILYLMESHYLNGLIEGLETARRLIDLHKDEQLKEILKNFIDLLWNRKYVMCRKKYSFLRGDLSPAEGYMRPSDLSPSVDKTSG